MKYTVNRGRKQVIAEVREPWDACQLGFYFVEDCPELIENGWHVYCNPSLQPMELIHEVYSTGNHHGKNRVRDIASHINTPPKPVHDCPKCDCKPEQGCCK